MRENALQRPQVWLHIGMPKTGTTAIQSTLYFNRDYLADRGIFYPDFGDNQHVALARKLAREAGSPVPFPKNGDAGPHEGFAALLDVQSWSPQISIISSENFFQRPACLPGHHRDLTTEPFELLRRSILATARYFEGCDVKVLIWLRRQDSWLMSMYNQTIKTSLYTESFRTFAHYSIGSNLLKIVQLWTEVFGKEQIVCRSYDKLSNNKVNIVESLLDLVCPNIDRSGLKNRDIAKNLSLSSEALWLKKRINALVKKAGGKIDPRSRQHINRVLRELTSASLAPDRPLLTSAERKALMGRYLADNEKLANEFGRPELWPLVDLTDLDELAAIERQTGLRQPTDLCRLSIDHIVRTMLLDPSYRKLNEGQRPKLTLMDRTSFSNET